MALSTADRAVLARAAEGLALVQRPFALLARAAGMTEDEAIDRLRRLRAEGAIKRLGLIVRHHELGYRANAMTVWDIPDAEVDAVGARMARLPFVTLCYSRRRVRPVWPYNLFAMVHGQDRDVVRGQIGWMIDELGLRDRPRDILFSLRRFKQRGARYGAKSTPDPRAEMSWINSTAAS